MLAPALISLLLILGGTLAAISERSSYPVWPHRWAWALNLVGVGLALYTFIAEAIRALPGGETAIRQALPVSFDWPLFWGALALLAAPVVEMGWQLQRRRR